MLFLGGCGLQDGCALDALGGRHEYSKRFALTSQFEFLGCELLFQLRYFAVELLPLKEFLPLLVVGTDLALGHVGELFGGEFGQVHALPVAGYLVVELEHTRADIDGDGFVTLDEFPDGFDYDTFVAFHDGFVGFRDARGGKEPVVIAVLFFGAGHSLVLLFEDVNNLVFFDLVGCDLCQKIGELFIFHCCESFVLGQVCEWPLIARASHT